MKQNSGRIPEEIHVEFLQKKPQWNAGENLTKLISEQKTIFLETKPRNSRRKKSVNSY